METIEERQAISFKKILVATDFSAVSKVALKYAAAIASRHGSKLYLTHVIPPLPRSFIPIEPMPPELDRERSHADRDMQSFIAGASLEHIDHELLLERGPTSSVLSGLIDQNEIDLLVLGTHGRTGIKKLVIGSVAEELFRLASCPVLTVGPAVPDDAKDVQVHQILFATDFGTASLGALPHAVALAREGKARLILLHILLPTPILDSGPYCYSRTDLHEQRDPARHKALERLAELVPAETVLSSAPECVARFDFLPQGILNEAAETKADLIVMGVRHTAFRWGSTHMPWTLAHEVVCHAKCPVLTVRS